MQLELAVPAFIVGLLILWKGSDMLIDATAKVAVRLGVSSLIISMTFVAYGTSMPEFAVSVGAALENNPSVSFGNILGSCVANLLLVLGLSAIIRPISVQPAVLRQEMPLMIGATLLLFLLPLVASVAPGLFWTVGILYLVCFAAYIWYVVKRARADAQQNGGPDLTKGKIHTHLPLIGLGIAAVVFGAWLLLEGAVAIARFFSISEMFIALSMVAVGTSLPELVVSLAAMAKGESDIAVGNIIGSNIFNILLVLGACSLLVLLSPAGVFFQLSFLTVISLLMILLMNRGLKLTRGEGVVLLAIYIGYLWYSFSISGPSF